MGEQRKGEQIEWRAEVKGEQREGTGERSQRRLKGEVREVRGVGEREGREEK